jgi:acetylornithine deacetylase/succinyl-diaminopimelate desuccinylase-like protein
MIDKVLTYAHSQRERYLKDLLDYIAIPSISAQPEHDRDVRMAALWMAEHLREIGVNAEVMETGGHPVVYGEWKSPHPHASTVLIYGHYDVQPPEPFELWHSDPFKAEIRNGNIYARGADDNKGQHMAHVKAVESYLKCEGTLPTNVKFLIEGEEEIGGVHLSPFVEKHKDLLACDCVMVSDGALFAPGQPSITYGLRGLLDFEISVRALGRDVHSGHYGGNVQNPAFALAQLLSKIKDDHGRVIVPGFYEGVRELSEDERTEIARVPWGADDVTRETGALAAFGDPDFSANERKGARPTFEINGMWSGYTGPGSKTIIPATAHAKITCRMVPNQNPEQILKHIDAYLKQVAPTGIALEVNYRRSSPASLVDLNTPQVKAAIRAAEATWGQTPVFELEGGSIPVVHDFITTLHKPVVLLGFGLPDDNIHSPNEKYAVSCYEKGIEASIRFLAEL